MFSAGISAEHPPATMTWLRKSRAKKPPKDSLFSTNGFSCVSLSDRVAFISFINSTSSTQLKPLVLNNESLGGFSAHASLRLGLSFVGGGPKLGQGARQTVAALIPASTQLKPLVLNNESLGGFFARDFRSQVIVAGGCSALGSVLRLFDERPVRAHLRTHYSAPMALAV
jgi:hypothetical protein